jgi:hypothetical protein
MFPVMLLGPSISGITLTRVFDGKDAFREFLARLLSVRFPVYWYAALLIPPVLVFSVLMVLEKFLSPLYAPNHFFTGVLFAIPAGVFGRDRLDGLRISKNAIQVQYAVRKRGNRIVLGFLAFAGHQLFRQCYAAWVVLACIFCRVCVGNDSHSCADRLALCAHGECGSCAVIPYQFHWVTDSFWFPPRERRTRSLVVFDLRNCPLASSRCTHYQLLQKCSRCI